jgi:voltage-gated potassium channel
MRRLMARRRHRFSFGRTARTLLVVGVMIVVGAALFQWSQHTSFVTALYWTITTVTTVGYGDVTATNPTSRIVAMVLMIVAVPVLGLLLADTASGFVEGRLRRMLGMSAKVMPNGYVLVLGWSPTARIAVDDLLGRNRHVMVVADVDALGIDHPHLQFLHDDPADENTLARVDLRKAAAALLCHDHDGDILISALALRNLAPKLTITAVPARRNTAAALAELGLLSSFPGDDLVGHVLSRSAQSPHAGPLLWQLVRDEDHRIAEEDPNSDEVGQSIEQVRSRRALRGEVVLGVLAAGTVRFALDQEQVQAGSRLLILRRA